MVINFNLCDFGHKKEKHEEPDMRFVENIFSKWFGTDRWVMEVEQCAHLLPDTCELRGPVVSPAQTYAANVSLIYYAKRTTIIDRPATQKK